MKLFSILIFYLITFCCHPSSIAQTLSETITLAHQNSYEAAIKKMQVSLSKAEVYNAVQKFLPDVRYSLERGRGTIYPIEGYSPNERNYTVNNSSFSVTQDLSLDKLIAKQITNASLFKADKLKYQVFLNDFTVDIVENYMDIIIAQENLKLAKDLEKSVGSEKHNYTIKAAAQSINATEYAGIESRYDDISSRVIQSEMLLEKLISTYRLYCKEDPKNLTIPDKFILPASSLGEYQKMVKLSNKSLEEIKARLLIANTAKVVSIADTVLPKVSAAYTDEKSVVVFLPNSPMLHQKKLTTKVEFAIYDRGEKINNIVKSNIQSRILEHEMLLMQEKLDRDLKLLWLNHHSLFLLTKAKRENLSIENSRLSSAMTKFSKGSISLVDLVKAKANFYNAKIEYLKSHKDFATNYYKILGMI